MDVRELLRHIRELDSDRAVQRATGIDRRTVQRYRVWAIEQHLLSGPLPPFEDLHHLLDTTFAAPLPPQMVSSVEPFRPLVVDLVDQGIEMVAIHHRLKERGFGGSYSTVRRFVHHLHPPPLRLTVRVETTPGEEAQVDFGYAGRMLDPQTGGLRKAWAFVMVLSWSRFMYVEFVFDQTLATWLRLHRQAFEFFGGVPTRIKLDNLKTAITNAAIDDPQIQLAYRECAEHYGFLIDPCRPRTPEHKGKVEQGGVHYVKRNFLGGRTPTTLTQANHEVLRWCRTTAGQRIHGTTKVAPLARFTTTERAALRPLPATPYDLAIWKVVRVHRDCYVVFDHAFYSVPFRLVGQHLRVRGGSREVQCYTQDWRLVATHPRASQPGERLTHPDHLPPQQLPGLLLGKEGCLERASEIGPATRQTVEGLLGDPVVDRLRTVGRVLRLSERFGETRLEAACARALRFGEPTHRTVKQILEQDLDREEVVVSAPPPARTFVRTAAELLGHVFGGALWS